MTPSSPEPSSLQAERAARRRADMLDAALGGGPRRPSPEEHRPGLAGGEETASWPADGDATVGLDRLLAAAGAARTHHRPPAPPPEGLDRLRAAAAGRQEPVVGRHRSFVRLAGAGTAAAAMLVVGLVVGASLGDHTAKAPPTRQAQVELHTVARLIDGARKALASSHPSAADSLLDEAQQLAAAGPSASDQNGSDALAQQLAHDQTEIADLQQQLSEAQAATPAGVPTTSGSPSTSPPAIQQPLGPAVTVTTGPPVSTTDAGAPTTLEKPSTTTTAPTDKTTTTIKSTTTTSSSTSTTAESSTTTTVPTSTTQSPTTEVTPTS